MFDSFEWVCHRVAGISPQRWTGGYIVAVVDSEKSGIEVEVFEDGVTEALGV